MLGRPGEQIFPGNTGIPFPPPVPPISGQLERFLGFAAHGHLHAWAEMGLSFLQVADFPRSSEQHEPHEDTGETERDTSGIDGFRRSRTLEAIGEFGTR
jgi:hypothetical protein